MKCCDNICRKLLLLSVRNSKFFKRVAEMNDNYEIPCPNCQNILNIDELLRKRIKEELEKENDEYMKSSLEKLHEAYMTIYDREVQVEKERERLKAKQDDVEIMFSKFDTKLSILQKKLEDIA